MSPASSTRGPPTLRYACYACLTTKVCLGLTGLQRGDEVADSQYMWATIAGGAAIQNASVVLRQETAKFLEDRSEPLAIEFTKWGFFGRNDVLYATTDLDSPTVQWYLAQTHWVLCECSMVVRLNIWWWIG